MILVDSSVWIDYFNNRPTRETDFLDGALQSDLICLGDIILAEVLQGFSKDGDYRTAKSLLTALPIYQILTPARAIRSADNFRRLRKKRGDDTEIGGCLDCNVLHRRENLTSIQRSGLCSFRRPSQVAKLSRIHITISANRA